MEFWTVLQITFYPDDMGMKGGPMMKKGGRVRKRNKATKIEKMSQSLWESKRKELRSN